MVSDRSSSLLSPSTDEWADDQVIQSKCNHVVVAARILVGGPEMPSHAGKALTCSVLSTSKLPTSQVVLSSSLQCL